jgi:hypothetical protein
MPFGKFEIDFRGNAECELKRRIGFGRVQTARAVLKWGPDPAIQRRSSRTMRSIQVSAPMQGIIEGVIAANTYQTNQIQLQMEFGAISP